MGDEGSSARYMTGSTTIILNFDYDALEDLRAEVTKREDGIRVADFVSVMCERLPHLYDYDKGLTCKGKPMLDTFSHSCGFLFYFDPSILSFSLPQLALSWSSGKFNRFI